MNQPSPQLSVVICTYNRAQYLINALRSLNEQTTDGHLFEVIIVDNASTDNTYEVCQSLIPQLKSTNFYLYQEKLQGASYARNTGAKHAKSPLLCFMDDDAVAHSDFIERIFNFFSRHPNAGGLGGRIIPLYIPEEPSWMSYYVSSLVGHFHYAEKVTEFRGGKFPFESNMTIPTALFREVGGFNEAIPGVVGTARVGGEGKELCIRISKLGHAIYYDPSVIVKHVVETNKLTPSYLTRVAQGIGKGERIRTKSVSNCAFNLKTIEYVAKLQAAILIGLYYIIRRKSEKTGPVIRFRISALRGLLQK